MRYDSGGWARWSYVYEETERRDTGTLTKIGRTIAMILGVRAFFPPVDVAYETKERHELTVYFDTDGIVTDYEYEKVDLTTRRVY